MSYKTHKEADYFQERRSANRDQKASKHFKQQVADKQMQRQARHQREEDEAEVEQYSAYIR